MNTYSCSLCVSFDLECSCKPTVWDDPYGEGMGYSFFSKFNEIQNKTEAHRKAVAEANKRRIWRPESRSKTSASNKTRDQTYRKKIIENNKIQASCTTCRRVISHTQMINHYRASH